MAETLIPLLRKNQNVAGTLDVAKHNKDVTFVPNSVELMDETYSVVLNGSNAVTLSESMYADVDIVHQLGVDTYTGALSSVGDDVTPTDLGNGDWNFVWVGGGSSVNTDISFAASLKTEETVAIDFTAVINSGGITFNRYYSDTYGVTELDVPVTIQNGKNTIILKGSFGSAPPRYVLRAAASTDADIDFVDLTIKEVTNTNSYLTMTDPLTQTIQTISSDPAGSSKELVVNGTFDTNVDDWVIVGEGVVTWEAGKARVDSTLSESTFFKNYFTTKIGMLYSITTEAFQGTSTKYSSRFNAGATWLEAGTANYGAQTYLVEATVDDNYID